MESHNPRGSRFKIVTRLGVLLSVLLIGVACQPVLEVDFQSIKCGPIKGVSEHFAKQAELYGCMVLIYELQTADESYSFPIAIKGDGQISIRGTESEATNLPPQSRGQKILTRIYLFKPEKHAELTSVAQHRARCLPMGAISKKENVKTYQCLHPNNDECWHMLLIEPKFTDNTNQTFGFIDQVKLQSPPEGQQSCRVCSREICGDNIDNNCDRKVDDYDDEKNQPCKK